ncbi:MAG: hypothetical protein AVDCRST_MAG34-1382, partial [uncultured Nocardioidaceae bacterium]
VAINPKAPTVLEGLLLRHHHRTAVPALLAGPVLLSARRGEERGGTARQRLPMVRLLAAILLRDVRELAVGVPAVAVAGSRPGLVLLLGVLPVQGERRPARGQGRPTADRTGHRPGRVRVPGGGDNGSLSTGM